MNKIEQIKADRDGLDVGVDLPRFARIGVEAIDDGDLERLKWWGVFFRRHTPGYFMMRIRIPNGMATAIQCRTIAAIANRWGRGVVDISTRQQLQLRWLRINDVPEILERLRAVDLVTLQTGMDNIRNVVGCSVAGLTPNELLDASPVTRALTGGFVGDRAFTNLPRKFNITVTGCRENCTHAETQDLALVPSTKSVRGETIAGFNVLVGGKNGSGGYRVATPLDVFVRPEDAVELCLSVVLLFRDHGGREARNKVRLSFLVDEWGAERMRDRLEQRMKRPLDRAGRDERLPRATDHVGVFRQKQPGRNYVGLLVPVGRMTGDQLGEVGRLAESYGAGQVRLTPDQNVIIPDVADTRLGKLTAEPLLKVLRYDPSEVLRGLVSCTGIEYCNLAVIETKNRALAIARTLEAKVQRGRPIRIHWSGCPAGCGNHTVADIGLLGTKAKVDGKAVDAVDVFVGGSSGPQPTQGIKVLENVPCEALAPVLESFVRYMEPDKVKRQLPRAGAEPPASSGEAVIGLDQVPDGAGRALSVAGATVAVFRRGDRLYALHNQCPHAGGALADGAVDGDEVICPIHGYRFNLATGACSTDPSLAARTCALSARGQGFVINP
jgi:ferredoxin-nitrite reductase